MPRSAVELNATASTATAPTGFVMTGLRRSINKFGSTPPDWTNTSTAAGPVEWTRTAEGGFGGDGLTAPIRVVVRNRATPESPFMIEAEASAIFTLDAPPETEELRAFLVGTAFPDALYPSAKELVLAALRQLGHLDDPGTAC